MSTRTSHTIKEQRLIDAKPEIIFTVLTSAADLSLWLCNEARCDARPGGAYELWWLSGYTVSGRFTDVQRPTHVAFTWKARGAPGETTVAFTLAKKRKGTEVTVRHTGFGRGAAWAAVIEESRKGWQSSLECLQHLVETGIDLREARRPMMGILLGELLTPERAAKDGLDVEAGVYLTGVVDGLSAQAAGLQAHDILLTIDGKPTPDYQSMPPIMQKHIARDRIPVEYLRGKEHKTAVLELKPRAVQEVPADRATMLAGLKEKYDQAQAKLAQALAGVSEEKAGKRPVEGEWSATETLAHLCVNESYNHYVLGCLLVGDEMLNTPGNASAVPECIAAAVAASPTVEALLKRLDREIAETLALAAAMRPEILENKARYRRMALTVEGICDHIDEHIEQIKAALAAA